MNRYRESYESLAEISRVMSDDLATAYADYGLTATQAASLTDAVNQFLSDRTQVEAQRSAYRAAVERQRASRQDLLDQIGRITATIYNEPSVTPAMIARLGLEPRDATLTRAVPHTPQSFVAVPNADGSVSFRWDRSGNSKRVNFAIETRGAEGTWKIVCFTSKTRAKAFGFRPGEEAWFRIYALVNDVVSPPSAARVIYPSGAHRLAA